MKKLLLSTLLLLLTLSAFSQKTYKVNTYYEDLGGYVIRVYNAGTHGTVVAMQDQGKGDWCQAASLANSNHTPAGAKFKDWFMPSLNDLGIMLEVYKNGNGAKLNDNTYWTSTFNDAQEPFWGDFSTGVPDEGSTSNIRSLRAIRNF
tara:strand:+ start:2292 stop:2732 length:441 start_codon:yes stop_codon:yes gene_type:complete